mmetsp:Transcript_3131/g.8639  ORF Transcript_3131/g.8639 Transcript_3131/m.8639 type:complete len:240 (+) Transcript_3131:303-1022(+)
MDSSRLLIDMATSRGCRYVNTMAGSLFMSASHVLSVMHMRGSFCSHGALPGLFRKGNPRAPSLKVTLPDSLSLSACLQSYLITFAAHQMFCLFINSSFCRTMSMRSKKPRSLSAAPPMRGPPTVYPAALCSNPDSIEVPLRCIPSTTNPLRWFPATTAAPSSSLFFSRLVSFRSSAFRSATTDSYLATASCRRFASVTPRPCRNRCSCFRIPAAIFPILSLPGTWAISLREGGTCMWWR